MIALMIGLLVVAGACGSSSDTEEAATGDDAGGSSTTETTSASTTTEATTTTTESTTTEAPTTTEPAAPVADLRPLLLGVDEAGPDFVAGFEETVLPAGEAVLTPCGNALDLPATQRAGSGFVFPGDEVGWPTDFGVGAVRVTAEQVTGENTAVADLDAAVAICPPIFQFPLTPDRTVESAGQPLEVPTVAGVEGTGYTVISFEDGTTWLHYLLSLDDLVSTVQIIGYGEETGLRTEGLRLAEIAQQRLADCVADPACRDAG